MPESTARPGATRWPRRALLSVLLAMAMALVWSAESNRRRIEQVSSLLIAGQASAYLEALFASRPDVPDLPRVLQENWATGLRYIALIDERSVLASAGEALGNVVEPTRLEPGVRRYERIGPHVRMVLTAPPPPGRGRGAGGRTPFGGQPPAPPPDGAQPEHISRPGFILEFEPTAANQLASNARRSVILSLIAASGFAGLGFLLWRSLRQREIEQERMAREHHLARMGEMSAVLAHEIRNPLASLKGHAQLLVEQLPAKTREWNKAERIVAEASRLEQLSSTLLELVRTGSIERRHVSPADLVRHTAEALSSDAIRLDLEDAPSRFSLDALRMGQVLTNLLRNALEASPEGEPIDVRVDTTNGALRFAVSDRGPGIADTKRIFEPFFTTKTRGVGLGLSVSRRIVEMHGGTIEARTREGGGTTFEIRVPNE